MGEIFEKILAGLWNRQHSPKTSISPRGLNLGFAIIDGQLTSRSVGIALDKRPEHEAILGKTGTGKSTLLRYQAAQDIRKGIGFVHFDLHGDGTPVLLSLLADMERRQCRDLSDRVIVIDPSDRDYSVGLNVLEAGDGHQSFVQIAEFAQILKQRWHLTSFGARTEELLRNSLYVLTENQLTLLELTPLLTNYAFRSRCLRRVRNSDVKQYFNSRYDRASEGMQSVMRDAILNKISTFASDPHFRHLLGQRRSSFSLVDAIDRGYWILLRLEKGRLGEQAATLGSLFLTKIKNALFSRKRRSLFTLYCDEIQNLVAFDSGLDTLLSEARKFGISVCSANQFLDQYPAQMRAAIMAVGSHIFFQLSSSDADTMAKALDGGKTLAELLRNLPKRRFVIKSGHHRWQLAEVPLVSFSHVDYRDLYDRCRKRWAMRRDEVEKEIQARLRDSKKSPEEVLREWT